MTEVGAGRIIPPFVRATVRLLPPLGGQPFVVNTFFCMGDKRELVLPSTFGFADPLWAARHLLIERGVIGFQTRYWYACVVRHLVPRDDYFEVLSPDVPYVLRATPTIGCGLRDSRTSRDAELWDAEHGCDVTIVRQGAAINTHYRVGVERTSSLVTTPEMDDFDAADHVQPFNRRRYRLVCDRYRIEP